MPEIGTAPPTGFLPRLESLRGLAAVSVVGFHAYGATNDTIVTGMAPVVLFFVLSGFVLTRSLERDSSPIAFFRNRAIRLFPAAGATVLLFAALHWAFGFSVGYAADFSPLNVLLNALMIRSDINGVMWSMTVECFASPLILAAFLLQKRFGHLPLLAISGLLFLLSFWGDYAHLLGGFTNLAPLYAFVIGVLLHDVCANARPPRHLREIAVAAAIALVVCGLRKQTAWTILGETAASAALIYAVAVSGAERVFALLDTTPARFMGKISYSFYLLHPIGMFLAANVSDRFGWFFVLATLFSTPMAWVSWRLIEVPFIELRRLKFGSGATATRMT